MRVNQALVALLRGETAAGNRVYPAPLPQGATLPAITYQQVSGQTLYTHDGDSQFRTARFQVDAWADGAAAVNDLAEEIHAILSGNKGDVGTPGDNIHITGIFEDNSVADFDPPTGKYRVMADYLIQHRPVETYRLLDESGNFLTDEAGDRLNGR